jgi:hypothetical protein
LEVRNLCVASRLFPDSEQTIKLKNGGVKLVLWTQTLS